MIDAAIHLTGWYLVLAIVGACALLPAALLGERLHTGGVLYARPLGLATVALACWLVAWFGWAPYGTPLAAGAVVVAQIPVLESSVNSASAPSLPMPLSATSRAPRQAQAP